jgi:DNA-binding transcriptional LysR family regulator
MVVGEEPVMDFHKLHYFMTVAKHEHMTQASQELHISQPALSKIISQLESELGVSLFERQGKSIKLNEHGRLFLDFTQKIIQDYSDICGKLHEYSDGRLGAVSIGCSFFPRDRDWITERVHDYMRTHDGVSFSCSIMNVEDLRASLEQHEIDIMITEIPVVDANVQWKNLFTERIAALMSPDHPLAGKDRLYVRDLKGETFFASSSFMGLQDITTKYCRKEGFIPSIRYRGNSTALIGEFVSRGKGVALISEHAIGNYIAGRDDVRLVGKILSDDYCKRSFGIAILRNRMLTKAALEFYEVIAGYNFVDELV